MLLVKDILKNKTDKELLADLDRLQYIKHECTPNLPNVYNQLLNIEKDLVTELQERFTFH
jgi:hypothetical protein